MGTKAKQIGRPKKSPTSGDRVSLGLRVTAEIKRKLDAAAEKSGRSQSQEAELRLERSFEREGLLREVLTLAYGEALADMLIRTGGVVQQSALIRAARGDTKVKLRRVETEILKHLNTVIEEEEKK